MKIVGSRTSDTRIAVTLDPGLLGSGKTTLLNAVLHSPGFASTLVIVNEFGEIGLDHLPIEGSQDQVIEVAPRFPVPWVFLKLRDRNTSRSTDMSSARDSGRLEVITGVRRRRRWTPEEKLALVKETVEPGMSVSLVARMAGIAATQLLQWKKAYSEGSLVAVGANEPVVPASENGTTESFNGKFSGITTRLILTPASAI